MKAQGSDAKGRGGANATATFKVEPKNGGSIVLIHTDLMLSGAVAQYGRGVGMIQATAAQIINQFAGNLRAQLAQQQGAVFGARTGQRDDGRRAIRAAARRQTDFRLFSDAARHPAADRRSVRAPLEFLKRHVPEATCAPRTTNNIIDFRSRLAGQPVTGA